MRTLKIIWNEKSGKKFLGYKYKMARRGKMRAPSKYRRRGRKMQMRRKRAGLRVLSGLNPIPARQIVKMKYADNINTAVGTAFNYKFNLNSIFDPNFTGTGHQPYGHDQLQALYNRYRVISCSYVITAYSGATGICYGVMPANEAVTFTTLAELRENPRARFITQYPGGSTTMLKGKVYIPSLVGRNKSQYMADDRYQAIFGASPQEQAVLNVTGLDLAEVGVSVNWTITLEYTVEVFDVKPLGQS